MGKATPAQWPGDNVRGMETLLISYCNFFIQEYYIFIRVFI